MQTMDYVMANSRQAAMVYDQHGHNIVSLTGGTVGSILSNWTAKGEK